MNLSTNQFSDSQDKDQRLTQAERTEISDQRMFEATVQLVVERGPSSTSLSDVGILAGYSRGLASNRFGSKDRLFAFVAHRLAGLWLDQFKQATEKKSGFAAVESAIDTHYQFCLDAPNYVTTLYTLWFESVNSKSELSVTIQKIHQRRFQDIVNWVLNDPHINEAHKRDADIIGAQFSASVIGIVYYWLANPEKLKETKRLHDGLKHTMMHLLR